MAEKITCKYWRTQKDGVHGNCYHPEALPGEACILNTEDHCVLRVPEEEEEEDE